MAKKRRRVIKKPRRRYVKFTVEQAEQIINLAKRNILGKEIRPLQTPGKNIKQKLPIAKAGQIQEIKQLLRKTELSIGKICTETNAKRPFVMLIYEQILAGREKIRLRIGIGSHRKKRTKPSFLRKKNIQAIMAKQEPLIVSKSEQIYSENQAILNRPGIYAEDIAQYIRMTLPWKLENFHPKRMKGTNLKTKINSFCSQQRDLLARDMLKKAKAKKYSNTKPAFAEIGPKEERPDISPEQKIRILETVAKKAGFTPQEKAVVFAKTAEMIYKQVSEIVGCTQPRISNIVKSARQKSIKAGINANDLRLMR